MGADTYDLTAERMLDAPAEAVFDAYTDPEAGRTVFAGGPDWVVEVACDLRVGGVWSIISAPPGGAAYHEANRFTVIDRPRRLAFTSTFTMPGGSDLQPDVEVTFHSDDGGGTRMTIVQQGFPSAEARDAFAAAFPGVFDRLERLARAWPVPRESSR
jgi:uncharacterized protein YndB with AHSA1/START domain